MSVTETCDVVFIAAEVLLFGRSGMGLAECGVVVVVMVMVVVKCVLEFEGAEAEETLVSF